MNADSAQKSQSLHILCLEDDPDFVALVHESLNEQGLPSEILHAPGLKEFAELLLTPVMDLILADFVLPDGSGAQALQLARAQRPEVPFILVSGRIEESSAVEMLKAGAADYVFKTDLERLVPAVRRAILEARGRARRKRAEMELARREGFFRKLMETSLDIFAVVDSRWTFQYVSPSVQQVLGWRPEQLAGIAGLEFVHPKDRIALLESFRPVFKTSNARALCELRFRCPDGSWRHLEIIGQNRLQTPEINGLIINARDIGERKRVESRLHESEVRLAVAQTVARLGSWEFEIKPDADISGWQCRWSDEMFRLLGIDPAANRPSMDLMLGALQADDRQFFLDALRHALRERKPEWITCRVLLPGGDTRHVELHVVLFSADATGAVCKVVGTLRDITEERKIFEALEQSEQRYQMVVQAADTGIWDLNLQTQKFFFSPRFGELLGYDESELGNELRAFRERVHPEDLERIQLAYNLHLQSGTVPFNVEFRMRAKSGEYRWFQSHGQAMRDKAGRPCRMVGGLSDVTEHKRAREHLQEQAALLDKAQDAILVSSLEGRVLYWNKGAERLHGWTAREVLQSNPRQFLYKEPRVFDEAVQILVRDGEWSGEVVKLARGGGELLMQTRWTLVRDGDGKPKSILSISTDITAKKRLEAQLLRSQRIESIGKLAGGIAHDLNNILAPILVSTAMLKERAADAEMRRILDMLETGAKRGADIVKQILWFSRGLEGQRILLNPKHVLKDIAAFVSETFDKSIRIETSIQPDIWPLMADPTHLHQVLLNLCVNSRDAMPSGGLLSIQLRNRLVDEACAGLHPGARPGEYIVFEVRDTGSGIPPEILEHIFEPFFTTKDVNKGTGLGLSTVLSIAQNYGGFIEVESQPGRGSSFRAHLPARPEAHLSHAPAPASAAPRGRGETVLLVDDEEAVLAVVQKTLELSGYRVLTARNGARALEIYAAHQDEIALVLMDLMMPVMDGIEAVRALRRANARAHFVAASGLGEETNRKTLQSLGVSHFVSKPYSAESLLLKLHEVLSQKPGSSVSGESKG